VEGQNIAFEYRWAEGRAERLPGLAAELVRLKADVLVTSSSPAVSAAKKATATIPIVFAAVSDPVSNSFVASLARPGGNVTGLSNMAAELSGKRLDLLKATVPSLPRAGLLWNGSNQGMVLRAKEAQEVARALGVALLSPEVRSLADLEKAFASLRRDHPGALLVLIDPFTVRNRQRIVDFAAETRLPAMYEERIFVDAGGLMSYGPSLRDNYRRAAVYVDKILKGAKPANLPVEQPMRFEFVVNLKTAKVLGLTIPQSILIRADQVIQ
jgi:putative ABC transport system substrate-binding protein